MILITGATGIIGTELARLLGGRGVAARAFHRRPDDAARFESLGLDTALGGFNDAENLTAAMRGCDCVFLLPPPTQHQEDHERAVLNAASKAGVKRIVKISAGDANMTSPVPWAKAHAIGENALRRSGLAWTVLRPSAFYQNFLQLAEPIKKGFLPLAAGSGRAGYIDAREVAAVAARVLTEDRHDRATYFLTGPADLAMKDIAEILSAVLGRRIRYINLPKLAYRAALRFNGVDAWLAGGLVAQFADVVAGGHDIAGTDEVERLTGQTPRSFKAFVDEHRGAFEK